MPVPEAWRGPHDPHEGVSPGGTIVTGVDRGRVPDAFEPVLTAALADVRAGAGGDAVALYVYGSVATGAARIGWSDVDLLAIGAAPGWATDVSADLSARFEHLCRGVDVAAIDAGELLGSGDEAYGNRLFLRHYCVHLAGPDHRRGLPDHRADARAARGLNGDIARHVARWRAALEGGAEATALGRTVARKTLLAVAGLVSVHDRTWTTDRYLAAARWSQIEPTAAAGLDRLTRWSDGSAAARRDEVADALDGTVAYVTDRFADVIGLWPT